MRSAVCSAQPVASGARRAACLAALAVVLAFSALLVPGHDGAPDGLAPPHPGILSAVDSGAHAPHLPLLLPAAHADHFVPCNTGLRNAEHGPRMTFISNDDTYGIGDTIYIQAYTSPTAPKNLNDLRHTYLALETGDVDRLAPYSHLGSNALRFIYAYTVQEGDHSDDLDYNATNALYWGTGPSSNMARSDNTPYNCRLSTPGTNDYQSKDALSRTGAVIVDGIRPTVESVAPATPAGTYGAGSLLNVTVNFRESVEYSGAKPTLLLRLGPGEGEIGSAEYSSGNGTDSLNFTYAVRGGDSSTALDYAGTDALATSGMLTDLVGNGANLTLPASGSSGSLLAAGNIVIDTSGTSAYATGVSSPNANGSYAAGTTVNVTVAFNRAVDVSGVPRLALATDPPGDAVYAAGSGTDELTFLYDVEAGDGPADLEYAGVEALVLAGGASIRNPADGTGAVLVLPYPGDPGSLGRSKDIIVDGTTPRLLGVTSPSANGTYGTGRIIDVTAVFHEPVVVEGTPALALTTSPPRTVLHAGGGASAALAFPYTVRPGDSAARLAYAGGSPLSLAGVTIRDVAGNEVTGLSLPATGTVGSLSVSKNIGVHGAKLPVLAAAGWLGDLNNRTLGNAHGVAAFRMGAENATYAIVTSFQDDGVQLIRVHENGTLQPVSRIEKGSSSLELNGAIAVDAFRMGADNATYAIVASLHDDGVELIRIHESNGTLQPVGRLADPSPPLDGARSVDAFLAPNGTAFALVASAVDDRVQLIRIHEGGTLQPLGHLAEGGDLALNGAGGVAAFRTANGTIMALVASFVDSGVQLIRVDHETGSLLPVNSATSADPGLARLGGAIHVSVLEGGGGGNTALALVTPENGPHAQLLRVYDNGTIEGAGSAEDGQKGFDRLRRAQASDFFEMGGRTYAVVASRNDHGVQLIHVRGDGVLEAMFSAGDDRDNFAELAGAHGIDVFETAGGRTYAIVASTADYGVQLIKLSPAFVANVSLSARGGMPAQGDQLNVTVGFDEPVAVWGPAPSLSLAFDGANRTAEYLSGNNTKRLVFGYAVQRDDSTLPSGLDYAGAGALTTRGIIADMRGGRGQANAADLGLPLPGEEGSLGDTAAGVVIGPAAPSVLSVSAGAPNGAYGTGRIVPIVVNLSAPALFDKVPRLLLDTVPPRNAAYAEGNGTDRLTFLYTVRPGDWAASLGYPGTGALSLEGGTVADGMGNSAEALPLPPPGDAGSLSHSSQIAIVGAKLPILRGNGSAVDDSAGGTYPVLAGARDVDAFDVNGTAYALVASRSDANNGGIQLIRIHPNGTLENAHSARHGGDYSLYQPADIAAFEMGGIDRAIVSAGSGIQLVDIHANGTLSANRSVSNTDAGFSSLTNAAGAAVLEAGDGGGGGGGARAIVAARGGGGAIQLVDIHANGTLSANNSASDGGSFMLSNAGSVDAFTAADGLPRALVTSYDGNAVQLVRIDPDGTLLANGSAASPDGFLLDSATGATAFEMGGHAHALATSFSGHGLQLLRVYPNGTMVDADSAKNGTGGFDALGGASDASVFEMGGRTYALVASYTDSGIQLVRIDPDGTISPAGSARDGDPWFDRLARAEGVAVFGTGGRTYALVAAQNDNAVQLVRLSPASVAEVSSHRQNGSYAAGSDINVTVQFDEPVRLSDPDYPPSLLLSLVGADSRTATYLSGSGTDTLVFNYTVRPGENAGRLDYAHAGALTARGAVTDLYGHAADLGLPEPGAPGSLAKTRAIAVDTERPRIDRVSSPNASRTYGLDAALNITVAFTEAVNVTGTPLLELETGLVDRNAAYSSGSGTEELAFLYTVQDGDESADLNYTGAMSLRPNGGAISDAAGNPLVWDLPDPNSDESLGGAKDIRILVAPEVRSVYSPAGADGTYAINSELAIVVNFSKAVDVTGTPLLELETGLVDRNATYSSGSGTREMVFMYKVREGDESAGLNYTGTGALSANNGSVRDASAPAVGADLALPDPASPESLGGSTNIKIDGVRPHVVSVSSPNGTGSPHGAGAQIHIRVLFSEDVDVSDHDPDAAPEIVLATDPPREAAYASGDGTSTLTFVYAVSPGDSAARLDYARNDSLVTGGGGIGDAAGNGAVLTLPDPGSSESLWNSSVAVDAPSMVHAAKVESVSSPGGDAAYGLSETVRIAVAFNASVAVAGTPTLALNISDSGGGALGRTAAYESGDGTDRLVFAYTVRAGDTAGDLDYVDVGALRLSGGAIDTAADTDIPASRVLPDRDTPDSLAGSGDIVIDGVRPEVESVSALSAGSREYGAGDTIRIGVEFSEPVSATGTPLLALSTTPARSASYADGTDDDADLEFRYAVQRDDAADPLDYDGTGALSLGAGGAIMDAAGNPALLALPGPGEPGSLLAGAGIVVRTDSGNGGNGNGGNGNGNGGGTPGNGGNGGGTPGNGGNNMTTPGGGGNGTDRGNTATLVVGPDSAGVSADFAGRGDALRIALNVSGIVGSGAASNTATFPQGGPVFVNASFASLSIPPGATASPVPQGGLLFLYATNRTPSGGLVQERLSYDGSGNVSAQTVVEIGAENSTIAFDIPVRVSLAGQAGGRAFYIDGESGSLSPIDMACAADDAARVHRQLGGEGECQLDAGGDKVIHTYHLTRFGTVVSGTGAPPPAIHECRMSLGSKSLSADATPGARSNAAPQGVDNLGSLPFAGVALEATPWYIDPSSDRPGPDAPSLPASLTVAREAGRAGEFALQAEGAAAAAAVAQGLGGGLNTTLWFQLDLTAHGQVNGSRLVQTVTYTAECAAPPS